MVRKTQLIIMGANTCYNIIRLLFVIFNFVGILMGVAMVAVGAYYYVEKGDFLNLLPKYEDVNITGVMIAAGIIVFVVSFIGFCGVWMESQCMLIMFFATVFVVLSLEIAVGIVGFIYRDDIDAELSSQLMEGMATEKRWPAWNAIQTEFQCCGVNNFTNWYKPLQTTAVLDSCCTFEGCGKRPELAYKQGCYSKVKTEIEDNFYALGAAGIALGVLQLLILSMTMVLICAIRKKTVVYV